MPMFQQRHYWAIAEAIGELRRAFDWDRLKTLSLIERKLSRLFARDNSKFKPHLFEAACKGDKR
jgi:hypothetical protein